MANIGDAKPSYIQSTSTIQNILNKKPLDIVTNKEWNNVLNTIITTINRNAKSSDVALDYITGILNGKIDFNVNLNAKTLEGHPVDDFILKDSLKPFTAITSTIEHDRYNVNFKVTKNGENSVDVSKAFFTSYDEKIPQYYFLYLTKDDNGDPTLGIITIGAHTSDYGTVLNEAYVGTLFDTNTLFRIPQYSYFAFMYSTPPSTVTDVKTDAKETYYNKVGAPAWEVGVVYNTSEYQDFVRHIFSLVKETEAPINYVTKSVDYYCEFVRADRYVYANDELDSVVYIFLVHSPDGTKKIISESFHTASEYSELLYLDTDSSGNLYIGHEAFPNGEPPNTLSLSNITDSKHDFRNYIAYAYNATKDPISTAAYPEHNIIIDNGHYIGLVLNPHKDTVLARHFIDRLYNDMMYNKIYNVIYS